MIWERVGFGRVRDLGEWGIWEDGDLGEQGFGRTGIWENRGFGRTGDLGEQGIWEIERFERLEVLNKRMRGW